MDFSGLSDERGARSVAAPETADYRQADYFLSLLIRMARIDGQDRTTLGAMIENLRRRFAAQASGDVPPVARRAPMVIR